jgi:hypothetical protein
MPAAAAARLALCFTILSATASTALAAEPLQPLKIVYIGNSYTYTHDIPGVVRALAVDAGFPEPLFGTLAQPSWFLSTHRASPSTVGVIDQYELDVVVLQEQSLRPTDPFNPAQFKADAAWFYDRVKATSPDTKIVLYETWARAAGDDLYPGTFSSPATMQSQLRAHYTDAALNYIPAHAAAPRKTDVTVAPVGDAWERELATFGIPLHDPDRSHPNFDGAYLCGLVLFSTIYQVPTRGLTALGRDPNTATSLQLAADTMVPEPTLAIALPLVLATAALVPRHRRRPAIQK